MKTSHSILVLAALLLTSVSVLADEVPSAPVTVTWESQRPRTSGVQPPDAAQALASLNGRLTRDLGDGNGWEGLGKAKIKLAAACKAPKRFKAASATGFVWTRTNTTFPPRFTATITNVVCE